MKNHGCRPNRATGISHLGLAKHPDSNPDTGNGPCRLPVLAVVALGVLPVAARQALRPLGPMLTLVNCARQPTIITYSHSLSRDFLGFRVLSLALNGTTVQGSPRKGALRVSLTPAVESRNMRNVETSAPTVSRLSAYIHRGHYRYCRRAAE